MMFANYAKAQFNRLGGEKLNQPYLENYQRVSAGNSHYLEIKNGKLYASGKNNQGQLGNSSQQNESLPVRIGTDENWIFVSGGTDFSMGIKADGTLWAWGLNDRGQLGVGNTVNSSVPVQVGSDHNWTSVSAGGKHTIALKSDGTLWAWGYNYFGQLGNGTISGWSASFPEPVQIGTDKDWSSISAGINHNLALKANGSLWAWGENTLGQLGNGSTSTGIATPVHIDINTKWRQISAGGYFSAALKSDGSLWAWGDNYYGQIANGNTASVTEPSQIGTNVWKNVQAGKYHVIATSTDGTAWQWGDVLGAGQSVPSNPVMISNISKIVSVSAGEYTAYALASDGKLYTWGKNNLGQLGTGSIQEQAQENPEFNGSKSNEIITVASGHGFSTMVLYGNGNLKGWGYNGDYNLGIGDNIDYNAPTDIPAAGENNISISVGYGHSLVLKDDGTAWGWGDNESGAVGSITGNSVEAIPAQIGQNNDWLGIIAGSFSSAGIKADGTLWTWGYNSNGNLGNGNRSSEFHPVRVGTENDLWNTISMGGFHTIAIKDDGTLWGWGRNYAGEAGGGSDTADILTPQQIGTDDDWVAVSAHTMSSYALKADGTLWGWGAASMGQLGQPLPLPTKILEPTRIGAEDHFLKAKLASWSGAGIIETGELKAWSNFATYFHELGIGDGQNHPTPVLVPDHNNIVQISTGQNHKSILKASRTDVCMVGRNANGEVGMGTNQISYATYQCGIAAVENENQILSVAVSTENNVPAVISEISGTLKLQAVISPAEANQEINWSISEGGNLATIDQNGLVTAIANGTVIVRATSVEETSAYGEISIEISGQLSTVENTLKNIQLYPNPTKGLVTIQSPENIQEVVVYNTLGQKVLSANSEIINLENLPSGIYLVKIKLDSQEIKTIKVIKQ